MQTHCYLNLDDLRYGMPPSEHGTTNRMFIADMRPGPGNLREGEDGRQHTRVVVKSGPAHPSGACAGTCACQRLPPVPAMLQAGLLAQSRLLLSAQADSAGALVSAS